MSKRAMKRAQDRNAAKQRRRDARLGKRAAVAGGAALGATVLFAPAADAATFTVTDPGDAGAGTLRDAISQANADAVVDDINFSVTGPITLTTGDIDITEPVNLNGPGAQTLTISGNDNDNIFYISTDEQEPVLISGLTLRDGNSGTGGGAIEFYDATLTIRDSVLTSNETSSGPGGAIETQDGGTLISENSVFSDNIANGQGGAIWLDANVAAHRFSDTTITGNTAGDDGGGLVFYSLYNPALIERSTISGNTATDSAGGLLLYNAHEPALPLYDGSFVMRDTTISGNTAGEDGGGIFLYEIENTVDIENSTVSGNTATDDGGGVFLYNVDDSVPETGAVALDSVTVAGNTGDVGDGIFLYDDGNAELEQMTLRNTIVADNGTEDIATEAGGTSIFHLDYSLIENPGTATRDEVTAGSNITATDPQLGPLADNGGPTQTHLPAESSPAIDKGNTPLTTDQRGLARPFDDPDVANATGGDGSDIGAVERQAAVPVGTCKGEAATVVLAAPGATTLGTAGPDVIVGTAGADSINGGGGNDLICGGKGKDDLEGGGGADEILGGTANDEVAGNDGKDVVRGQAGNDVVRGDKGNDTVRGGKGDDRVLGAVGNDLAVGGDGKDRLVGAAGNDKLRGQGGADVILGSAGADTLKGGRGNDRLLGGAGRDVLIGGPGNDQEIQD